MTGEGVAGRGGSGVGLGLIDPDWLGFHIALKVNPFLSQGTGGMAKATPMAEPEKSNQPAVRDPAAPIGGIRGCG